MSVEFYYKGLSIEEHIYPHTPSESVRLAKKTLYESWFDTLQTSPWYTQICETKIFPTDASKDTWKHFGDLRNLTFEQWWLKTGYKIFSEKRPYSPINQVTLDYAIHRGNDGDRPPSLILEIPLNLSPAELSRQFDKLVEMHMSYVIEVKKDNANSNEQKPSITAHNSDDLFSATRSFNRWQHSTAEIHQQRDTKMTYQQIKHWLTIFKAWESARLGNPKLTQAQFALDMKLSPEGKRLYYSSNDLTGRGEQKLANATSEQLKMARALMAHATEGVFPCTEPHQWATGQSRKKRKSNDES
jgi:hypothetical protein